MSEVISDDLFLFRLLLKNRRFGDEALRILESMLVARDVRLLLATRSALGQLLRSEAGAVMGEISETTADRKLCVADFFVRAFALVGDVESCLALKYEAFVLRETKYYKNHGLQVSYKEWLTFAKDSLDNGFYTIAAMGFERALLSFQSNTNIDPEPAAFFGEEIIIRNIKKLKDKAISFVASQSEDLQDYFLMDFAFGDQSVQMQSAEYLKRKIIKEKQNRSLCSTDGKCAANSMFRYGIKKRNFQKLYQSQMLSLGYQQTINN